MSRAATGLAYRELRTALDPALHTGRPGGFRLLGGDQGVALDEPTRAQRRPTMRYATYSGRVAPSARPAYRVWVWNPAPAPADAIDLSTRRWKIGHPQWLFGTLLCVVAFLAVSPAFARGRLSSPPNRMAASGAEGHVAMTPAPAGVSNAPVAAKVAPATTQATTRRYELLGAPSLSLNQIETVLQQYASPAVGHGRSLYDLGVRYGIDPAYALAFFVHESGCGTRGVARYTHSIGNIRWIAGYDNYEGYRSYPNWEAGIEDWYALVTDLYIDGWNLRTVDEIVPVYAPYGDNNNPPGYISAVKGMVDSWRGK